VDGGEVVEGGLQAFGLLACGAFAGGLLTP